MSAQLPAQLLHNRFAQLRTSTAQLGSAHTLYTTYIIRGGFQTACPGLVNRKEFKPCLSKYSSTRTTFQSAKRCSSGRLAKKSASYRIQTDAAWLTISIHRSAHASPAGEKEQPMARRRSSWSKRGTLRRSTTFRQKRFTRQCSAFRNTATCSLMIACRSSTDRSAISRTLPHPTERPRV